MPQSKNALAPNNYAFNMLPYESQYGTVPVEGGYLRANNVYSALLPELMRAHFKEYLAFSPATVTNRLPNSPTASGEFDQRTREVFMAPYGTNSMLMKPLAGVGYVGANPSNTSTSDTLNSLRTMLHEATHARMSPAKNEKLARPHPAEQLAKMMPADRFDEMLRDIRISSLPSTENVILPGDLIDELFSTAIPARLMASKNMKTKHIDSELREVERLAKKYPELDKMMRDWERPELFIKGR